MPLDEYTKLEVEGLLSGDLYIPIGQAKKMYEDYNEAAKITTTLQMVERMSVMHKE